MEHKKNYIETYAKTHLMNQQTKREKNRKRIKQSLALKSIKEYEINRKRGWLN